jgi:hypothetical protein
MVVLAVATLLGGSGSLLLLIVAAVVVSAPGPPATIGPSDPGFLRDPDMIHTS